MMFTCLSLVEAFVATKCLRRHSVLTSQPKQMGGGGPEGCVSFDLKEPK